MFYYVIVVVGDCVCVDIGFFIYMGVIYIREVIDFGIFIDLSVFDFDEIIDFYVFCEFCVGV